MTVASDQVFRFGAFTLDLDRGTLVCGEESVFLRPKAFAVLTHLARNAGRVVPKSELMDTVWPGVFVTEDSLTQSVREIRKAVGEELVRTVSKRGYMLAAQSEPDPQPVPEADSQSIVAVLRFHNESGDPGDVGVVDGLAEDIINGLARFAAFTVLARNSSFSFASFAPSDWPQIRSRIGADFLVEGSVRRQGDRLTVAVNLVDAAGATQLWGDRFQAEAGTLFGMQEDIIGEIVGRLAARVEIAGLQRVARKPLANLAAWELAMRSISLGRDPAQTDLEGIEALGRAAIDKDPSLGLGYTGVAIARALAWEFGNFDEAALADGRDLADKGASLSPDQAACRRVQSLVRLYLREHEAAEHYLKLALELNPHDAECVSQMGFLAIMRGRPLDALAWTARAMRLNPLDPHWCLFDRSLALYQLCEYADAVKSLQLASRPTPWVRTRLAACFAQLGEMDEAGRQAGLINEGYPDFSPLDYVRRGLPFENAADAEHFAEGVMLALGHRSHA
jgi:TolB-like protein